MEKKENMAPKTIPSPSLIINWLDNGLVCHDDIVFVRVKGCQHIKLTNFREGLSKSS